MRRDALLRQPLFRLLAINLAASMFMNWYNRAIALKER